MPELLHRHQGACRRRRAAIREHVKILPGCLVVVGDTDDEARAKTAQLDSLVHPDSGIAALSIAIGMRRGEVRSGRPLPDIPETNQSKAAATAWLPARDATT